MNTKTTEKNLAPYQKSTSLVLEKACGMMVRNDEEIKIATDILSEIGTIEKNVKAEREKLTKPALEIVKWARRVFGPIEKKCQEAEYIIKDKMISYNKILEDKNKKKLEQISKKVASGKMDIDKASEKVEDLKSQNNYQGDEGGKIQFKRIKRIYYTDESKLPRKYLIPNERLIREDLLSGMKISGAEVRIEKIIAKR